MSTIELGEMSKNNDIGSDRAPSPAHDSSQPRVRLAVIANSLPPYRVHFHRRIVSEMPEVRLYTICTHQMNDGRWSFDPPPELNAHDFSMGQSMTTQGQIGHLRTDYRRASVIIDLFRREEINAVISIGYNDITRLRAISWCKRNAIPCFLWGDSNIRGDFASGVKGLVKQLLVRRVVKSCAGVMPCGSLGAEYFRKYGAEPERTFFVPYEPDYMLIDSLPQAKVDATAARYALLPGRRRFIFSARLVDVKRPDLVIDAFAKVADARPDWDLVLAGDGPLRKSMEERVPESLRQRVTFTGFIDDQSVVSALYRLSDVLLLPSDYEPWALVVTEAAAAGLALICTDVVGAAAELVRSGENGALVPTGDVAALAKAMLEVSDPSRIDSLKSQSKRVLHDWRQRGDPVAGLRSALHSVGLLDRRQ